MKSFVVFFFFSEELDKFCHGPYYKTDRKWSLPVVIGWLTSASDERLQSWPNV